jgi:hypothetical protein
MLIKVVDASGFECPKGKANPTSSPHCSGSLCMAWRWADEQKWTGYCGLAGIPLALEKND